MQTVNFQMFKLVLEKAEELEVKLPTSDASLKKQESTSKTSISALLTMPKSLTVWITTNCGKFWKRWDYQTTLPVSGETCMQVKKQQLRLDMGQQTGSNWRVIERLKVGGEGDDREDSWMVSPTWWKWVWAYSGRWWQAGKPGTLQSMASQRVRHSWATE